MAKESRKFETVSEYIGSFPKDIQKILKTIQKTIKDAVPDSEEVISYSIPAFRYKKGWIFYYSVYTSHYTLSCPPPWTIHEKYKKELGEYELSKSSIKFPLDKPVPVKLIAAMSKFRADEIDKVKPKKK
ncbi:MAG TPA: DUF1801 domain-containing protein [Cyclobacteriaceae bacterium]|nr:DUF1801 domain-containing protein [Cyclobacteriaceae bacterium]